MERRRGLAAGGVLGGVLGAPAGRARSSGGGAGCAAGLHFQKQDTTILVGALPTRGGELTPKPQLDSARELLLSSFSLRLIFKYG